jgi:hypothetical protein
MGTITWPCAKCGQQQKKEIQTGEVPTLELCAACAEEKEFTEAFEGTEGTEGTEGKKGKKEKHAH